MPCLAEEDTLQHKAKLYIKVYHIALCCAYNTNSHQAKWCIYLWLALYGAVWDHLAYGFNQRRDHFWYRLSQWETALQCNAVSHWLRLYSEWSLSVRERISANMGHVGRHFTTENHNKVWPYTYIGDIFYIYMLKPCEPNMPLGSDCISITKSRYQLQKWQHA